MASETGPVHQVYDATSRSVQLGNVPTSLLGDESDQYQYGKDSVSRKDIDFAKIGVKSRGFVLQNLFSAAECATLIQATQSKFDSHSDVASEYPADYRSNSRLIVMHDTIAQTIWTRLLPHLHEADVRNITPVGFATEGTWLPVGVNDCFLFSRYERGQFFKPHFDGLYKSPVGDCSIFTITIYLNDNFEGGRLKFLPESPESAQPPVIFQPVCGSALIFNHDTLHEGEVVHTGTKYILRTSIMFRRVENLTDPLRGWEKNADWQRMRAVFSTFASLNAARDPVNFTSKYLECQAIQLAHGRSIHQLEPLPLPEDIWLGVFDEIDFKKVVSTFRVSKSWKSTARSGKYWRARLLRDFSLHWDAMMASDSLLMKCDPGIIDWFSIYRRIYRTSRAVDPFGVFLGNDVLVSNLDASRKIRFPSYIVDLSDPWDASFTHWRISRHGSPCSNGTYFPSKTNLLLAHAQETMDKQKASGAAIMLIIDPKMWLSDKESRDDRLENMMLIQELKRDFRMECVGLALGVIAVQNAAALQCSVNSALVVACSHSLENSKIIQLELTQVDLDAGIRSSTVFSIPEVSELADSAANYIKDALRQLQLSNVIFIAADNVKRDPHVRDHPPDVEDADDYEEEENPDEDPDLDADDFDADYHMGGGYWQQSKVKHTRAVTSELKDEMIDLIKTGISKTFKASSETSKELKMHVVTPSQLCQAAIRAPFASGSKFDSHWLYASDAFRTLQYDLAWTDEVKPANDSDEEASAGYRYNY